MPRVPRSTPGSTPAVPDGLSLPGRTAIAVPTLPPGMDLIDFEATRPHRLAVMAAACDTPDRLRKLLHLLDGGAWQDLAGLPKLELDLVLARCLGVIDHAVLSRLTRHVRLLDALVRNPALREAEAAAAARAALRILRRGEEAPLHPGSPTPVVSGATALLGLLERGFVALVEGFASALWDLVTTTPAERALADAIDAETPRPADPATTVPATPARRGGPPTRVRAQAAEVLLALPSCDEARLLLLTAVPHTPETLQAIATHPCATAAVQTALAEHAPPSPAAILALSECAALLEVPAAVTVLWDRARAAGVVPVSLLAVTPPAFFRDRFLGARAAAPPATLRAIFRQATPAQLAALRPDDLRPLARHADFEIRQQVAMALASLAAAPVAAEAPARPQRPAAPRLQAVLQDELDRAESEASGGGSQHDAPAFAQRILARVR